MKIRNDLSGQTINRLTIINPIYREKGERTKYLCECTCGKQVIVDGSKIVNGHTKSCGCIKELIDHSKKRKLPKGEGARNKLIGNYKQNAKRKDHEFTLTNIEMIEMFQSNCYYCGTEPVFEYKHNRCNGGYLFNGIDRLDSSKGYTLENTVPCCTKCNFIKGSHHHDNFVLWIELTYNNLKNNNIL